ncbi:MAG: AAA family ATPase, partial [Lachnospiraceae bacterium]|nr:AAA family ATPase [Lachnospiraceae bacterium]
MKRLGIGYEDYKRFVDEDLYFVDKTMLIKEVLERGGIVTLFTRPRRFGKTLALSMLRTFFELEYDLHGNIVEKGRYFTGKKVSGAGEEILKHMGQYPVIHMSLKSAKQADFYSAFLCLREEIIREYDRHRYVLNTDRFSEENKRKYQNYLSGISRWEEKMGRFSSLQEKEEALKEEVAKYATALRFLSECLFLYHDKKVIILLDEYDVPLETAYYQGFYQEMVGFIRSLFESALKTNEVLERAMITGCLRISRESIFTGLNHLSIVSIRSESFAEGFGFTQKETEEFLAAYGLESKIGEVMQWYDGYLFGDTEIYNPWSLILYIEKHIVNPDALPEPYWPNTSSNMIIKDLVEKADAETKKELEELIAGGTVEKRIHEDITYEDIYESDDNLWNFLYFTGYMKKVSETSRNEGVYLVMCIP